MKMNLSHILKRKLNYLMLFFVKQCYLLSTINSPGLHYFTDKRLLTIKFSSDNTFDIIQKLDPNKVHNHDMISIQKLD